MYVNPQRFRLLLPLFERINVRASIPAPLNVFVTLFQLDWESGCLDAHNCCGGEVVGMRLYKMASESRISCLLGLLLYFSFSDVAQK